MKSWLDDQEWTVQQTRAGKNNSAKKPRALDGMSHAQARPKLKSSRGHRSTPTPQIRSQKDNEKVHLSLSLSLPKPKLPQLNQRRTKTYLGLTAASFVLIAGITIATQVNNGRNDNPRGITTIQEISQAPEFDALRSSVGADDKDASNLVYDSKNKVYKLSDKITGVEVVVSQQQLPDNFKANPEMEVEKIAKNFNADKIIYAGEVRAFSGISEKGPQTIIFTKKNLLIFIKAPKELNKDGLAQYIIDLK